MRPGILLTVATAILLTGLVLLLLNAVDDARRIGPPRLTEFPPAQTARTAPDFQLRTFDGRAIALSDFRGKVVVINFWASWCTPCTQEMPNLQRVWQAYGARGVVVLGLNVQDDPDNAQAFLRRYGIAYPNVYDPGQERMHAYQVTALPTTVFIDRAQRIRGRAVGGYLGDAGYAELRRQLEALLAAP